jgi:hypothetical protein
MVWGESQGAGIQQTNLKTGERGRVNKPSWNEKYREWEDSIATLRGDPLQPASKDVMAKIDAIRVQQKKDSADLQIRYNWESPFFLSPHNPQVFYLGASRVLKSLKRGEDLYPISPDLSIKPDPAQERARLARLDTVDKYTGGITLDLTGAEAYGTVVALQESPLRPGLLLAGTDNGNVWMTHNDGANWENLTSKFVPLGVPWDAYVVRLEPSHFDTLTFYVAFENHRWNDFTPYLFVTNDGGKSFRSIVNNLPKTSPQDYLHVVREDPHNRDLLFVGSSRSVYVSIDRGQNWTKFAGEPSVGSGLRSADSSARSRVDRRDARAQPVDRRHRGARADDAESGRAGDVPVCAEDGISVGRRAAAWAAWKRLCAGCHDVREPARTARTLSIVLAQRRRDRSGSSSATPPAIH